MMLQPQSRQEEKGRSDANMEMESPPPSREDVAQEYWPAAAMVEASPFLVEHGILSS
jgi:hypothetical protein